MNPQPEMETICCPKYEPDLWDDKTLDWQNKHFIKASVFTLFFMPVNFGSIMKKLDKQVKDAGASISDWLCLSDHTSKWNMDVYLAVDMDVPGANNTAISGKFYSKVYEGPFRETEKWCNDYGNIAESKGLNIKKRYMWYTTCPKCAKKYGKNYVAIMGQIE